MAEIFREDPAFAVGLLNDILAGGDQGELLVTLRQMTKAFGGMAQIAAQTQTSRTQLYKTLSAQGNPELRSLSAILATLGLRLAVQPIKTKARAKATTALRRKHTLVAA
jgi:probable addiction module antidote protein